VAIDQDPVERWFVRRGVPHFARRAASPTETWVRAVPLLVVAYVAGGLNALDLAHWSWQRNLLVAAATVLVLAATWVIANVLRHRPPANRLWTRPRRVGPAELAVFLLGPSLPPLLFGQVGDAIQAFVGGAVVLVVIYGVTSYGVLPLLGWAGRRSAAQLGVLGRMVVRALPLLLLFTTFLFINAEVWQVAGTLAGPVYPATIAVFFVLGSVFVLSRIPATMRGLDDFTDWSQVRALVVDTPAGRYDLPTTGRPDPGALSVRERVNIGLVSLFSQALQITFVAVLLAVFFVVFGFLAIPEATAASWTQLDDVHVLLRWNTGGRDLVVTEPLLRVAGFLGAFTGMYFTVVLTTDATYRDEFAEDVGPQVRQALAVRCAYRWHTRAD
jgi:hypothetical protein